MARLALLLLVALAVCGTVRTDEGARLLASKSLLNKYAVEGQDLTVQYNIYNVGSSAALDVELNDDAFHPEQFGIVSGMLNVKWERIAPYPPLTHTEEGAEVVIGHTSAPGEGGILAQKEYDRKFSPHYLDWAAFGVMTLPSIGIPLLLWYSSKRKYDALKSKKN